jgi:hypothetical protein
MHVVLDNLTVFVVGAVLLGVMAVLGLQRQGESIALAEHHATTGRTAALSDWLRGDLASLTVVTSRTDSTFSFQRISDPGALTTTPVEYRRVRIPGLPVRYQIVRREGTTERVVGPVLSSWTVTLLTVATQPTTTPSAAAAIRIRSVTPPGLTRSASSTGSVWERTFTPRMLGRTNV